MNASIAKAYEFLRQNRLVDASDIARQLLGKSPYDYRHWALMRDINSRANRHDQAVYCAKRVLELGQRDAQSLLALARIQVNAGLKSDAIRTMSDLPAADALSAAQCDAAGALLSMCDEPGAALGFSGAAVANEPENPTFVTNLAMIQRMLGKFEDSERNFDKAILLNPGDYRAYYSRSDLRRWTVNDNHIADMEAVLTRGVGDWRGEVALRYALAKEYEDLADFDHAIEYVHSACRLQKQHTVYDVQSDVDAIDHIIATHNREGLSKLDNGYASKEPIFVVGLPRTGTTLVERILGSHSKVYAAGELTNLGMQVVTAVKQQYGDRKFTKQEMIDKSLEVDAHSLGKAYIESTRPRTGHTSMFIDKLPLNYLYCGLINRVLPNARIILLKRNPMDACFAMYRMMFLGIYPFSYDLQDLGEYFLAFNRLADHWEKTLGDAMMVVQYEDLVVDSESQIRSLVAYCDLEFEPGCLDFHQNKAPSTTASAVQVRSKIYSTSVGKWKNYEEHLGPLRDLFRENGLT